SHPSGHTSLESPEGSRHHSCVLDRKRPPLDFRYPHQKGSRLHLVANHVGKPGGSDSRFPIAMFGSPVFHRVLADHCVSRTSVQQKTIRMTAYFEFDSRKA